MSVIRNSAKTLAKACNGNPVLTTACVMLFYVMLNICMASIETLVFGNRFDHWGDVIFQLALIGYAAYCVYMCAIVNSESAR